MNGGDQNVKFGWDHAHFVCRDVDRMVRYFEKVFGAERVREDANLRGARNITLRLGGCRLMVRSTRTGEAFDAQGPRLVEGLDHLGLSVDDLKAACPVLKERGAKFIVEPSAGVGGRLIAFVEGPENIRIELCEPMKG
ncbi:MAG: VOC family protein [Nitrospinota bacterium]